MNDSVLSIPLTNLLLSFIPVLVVIAILYNWSLTIRTKIYAVIRMLVQLLAIGYVLSYIFAIENPLLVVLVLCVMLTAAGLISLRTCRQKDSKTLFKLLLSISTGGISSLLFMTAIVLEIEPWYLPNYLIPLGGMAIANCMNTASLAAERFESEIENETAYIEARNKAFNAALIPTVNTLLAVGIVSLPGMMTGQILSGVDPLIAVRYQIIIMCMVFGSSGITAACYLALQKTGTIK